MTVGVIQSMSEILRGTHMTIWVIHFMSEMHRGHPNENWAHSLHVRNAQGHPDANLLHIRIAMGHLEGELAKFSLTPRFRGVTSFYSCSRNNESKSMCDLSFRLPSTAATM